MQLNHHRVGSGPPLVLIHGIGHRWQGWLPVIERLRHQREVLALDLPGFGDSPMPAADTPAGVESLSTLVSEFLDGLGWERPHLAGNSLGGFVSLVLARRQRAASATALSPAGFQSRWESAFSRNSLRLARALSRRLDGHTKRLLDSPTAVKLGYGQMAVHPERIPAGELAGDVHALAHCPWFSPTLEAITRESFTGGRGMRAPVTIAWGEHDRLLLPRQARRAAHLIPHARVRMLPGCGHVPFHDDPDQVAEVLLEGSAGRS